MPIQVIMINTVNEWRCLKKNEIPRPIKASTHQLNGSEILNRNKINTTTE